MSSAGSPFIAPIVAGVLVTGMTTSLVRSYATMDEPITQSSKGSGPIIALGGAVGLARVGGPADDEEAESEDEKAQLAERAEEGREEVEELREEAEERGSRSTPPRGASRALLRAYMEIIDTRDPVGAFSNPCRRILPPYAMNDETPRVRVDITRTALAPDRVDDGASALERVANAANCTSAGGFYVDDSRTPEILELCPTTCETIRHDVHGMRMNILVME